MATIQNTNEKFGDAIAFSGRNLDEAVSRMQLAIRDCGFENAVVTEDDYDILDESEIACPECWLIVEPEEDTIGCGCHCPQCGERM